MIKRSKIIFKDYKPVLTIVSSDYDEIIKIADLASAITRKPPIDNKMRFLSMWKTDSNDETEIEIHGKSIKSKKYGQFFHANPGLNHKYNYLEILIDALVEKNILPNFMKRDLIDTIHAYYNNTLFDNEYSGTSRTPSSP